MNDFFEKHHLTDEMAEGEAKKMRDIVGSRGSKEDYQIANELIEDEKMEDPRIASTLLQEGQIAIIPPKGDKHVMIALDIEDPKLYGLFNDAACRVTKRYGGFHQVGAGDTTGYTAWELWNLQGEHPSRIVDEIYREMRRLRKLYYPDEHP